MRKWHCFLMLALYLTTSVAIIPGGNNVLIGTDSRLKRALQRVSPPPTLPSTRSDDKPWDDWSAVNPAAGLLGNSMFVAEMEAIKKAMDIDNPSPSPSPLSSPAAPPATPAALPSGGCVGCTAHSGGGSEDQATEAAVATPPLPFASDSACVGCSAHSGGGGGVNDNSTPPSSSVPSASSLSPIPTPASPIPTLTDVSVPPVTPSEQEQQQTTNAQNDFAIPPVMDNKAPDVHSNDGACVGCTVQPPAEQPVAPAKITDAGTTCIGCTVQPPPSQ